MLQLTSSHQFADALDKDGLAGAIRLDLVRFQPVPHIQHLHKKTMGWISVVFACGCSGHTYQKRSRQQLAIVVTYSFQLLGTCAAKQQHT
jgi:hypothetical protein